MIDKPADTNDDSAKKKDGAKNRIPAGPHARPDLTDREKTPGTGSLPDDKDGDSDVGPD